MDEYGSELTFNLLDELARASVRGRVAADESLASRHVGRVGPLLELLLMDRDGKLPLGALPDCQTIHTLTAALSPANNCRATYGSSDTATIGFITAGRNTATPEPDEELRWHGFRQKAQQAAELSLPKSIAQGLMGAMTEIEENIHRHSERNLARLCESRRCGKGVAPCSARWHIAAQPHRAKSRIRLS
jgi:hypothetical protein